MEAAEKVLRRLEAAGGSARYGNLTTNRSEQRALAELVRSGVVLKFAFGCYSLPTAQQPLSILQVTKGKLTCISAVDFAGLRTLTEPKQVHVALPRNRGLELPPEIARHTVIHRESVFWMNAINGASHLIDGSFTAPQGPKMFSPMHTPPSNGPTHTPPASVPLAPWPAIFARVAVCRPLCAAVVAIDSGLNKGLINKDEVQRLLDPNIHKDALKAVDLASPTSQSVLESVSRLQLVTKGFRVEPQKFIETVGYIDLLVEDWIAIELDGFAYHGDRSQFRNDRYRDRMLRKLGYEVLRYTYEEVINTPEVITRDVRFLLQKRHQNGGTVFSPSAR